MSDSIYPAAPRGLTFTSTKIPVTDTHVQTSPDRKSVTIPRIADPIWQWSLVYDYLKDTDIQLGELYTDLNVLRGFFLQQYGKEGSFLFTDPDDNTVTLGALPLYSEGGVFYSPIQRVFGGFAEDIYNLNPDSTAGSLQLYANGVLQTSGFTLKGQDGKGKAISGHSMGGLYIQWDAEPEPPITASFAFYFGVRFDIDQADFDKFMDQLWELGGSHGGTSSQGMILIGTHTMQSDAPCTGGTPTIISTVPTFLPDGSPNTTVTITGTNFRTDSFVTVNGSPRFTVYINSTTLQVIILSTDMVDPGTLSLAVTNPPPGCGKGPSFPFVIKPVLRMSSPGFTTFQFQPGPTPPQSDSNYAFIFEDAYTNDLYVVDTGVPAYLEVTGDTPAVAAWDQLDTTGDFSDGEQIEIGGVTYTVRTVFSSGPTIPNEIAQGAGAADTLQNLLIALTAMGTPGVEYSVGTVANPSAGGGNSGHFPPARAWGELDSTGPFSNGETITIGSVTYTMRTTFSGGPIANEIALGSGAADSFANLLLALKGTGTAGVNYSVGTIANPDAGGGASDSGSDFIYIEANTPGAAGNSIVTTTTAVNATWENPTLQDGANADNSGRTYLYVEANTPGAAGNSITASTTALNATWETPTFTGGADTTPTFAPFWTGANIAVSPSGHLIAVDLVRTAPQIGRAVFTGSGTNDLTSGGDYNPGTKDKTYTITIDPGGTTYTWDDGFTASTHNPIIAGTPLDLNDDVTITFGGVGGHVWMDTWQFKVYVRATKLQVWDVGYKPTVASAGAPTPNGPSDFVTASKVQEYDYDFSRLSTFTSYPAFKNVAVTGYTGCLTSGGKDACNGTKGIASFKIRNGGVGFGAGQTSLAYGRDGVVTIDTVDGSGTVLTGHVSAPGTEYVDCINVPCSGGTGAGSGLIIDIVSTWDENYNFTKNLTVCDCLQGIQRSVIDLQVDNNGDLYGLEYDTRTGYRAAQVDRISTACVATHGQFPSTEFDFMEISELTWDQVNLVKLPAGGSTLTQQAEWLMRYRVNGNCAELNLPIDPAPLAFTSRLSHVVGPAFIAAGGTGFAVNNLFRPVAGAETTPATFRVLGVDGGGGVTSYGLVAGAEGYGYVPNSNTYQSSNVDMVALTGSGTGLKLDFQLGGPWGIFHETTIQYRELLASPKIWSGANKEIVAIANSGMDFDAFLTTPLRVASQTDSSLGQIVVHSGAGGINYKKFDIIPIAGGTGGFGIVWSVDATTGEVLAIAISNPGSAYSLASNVALTGGSGTGLAIDIVALNQPSSGTTFWNGGMSIIGESGAIGTLHYGSATSNNKYFDFIPVGMWGIDLGLPISIPNPDPTNIGTRPHQALSFVAHDAVASQPLNFLALPFPSVGNWQATMRAVQPARSNDRTALPYNQIDGSGAITATKAMVDGSVKGIIDSHPSGHAQQTFPVCNLVLWNKSGWSASTDTSGAGGTPAYSGGYRLVPSFGSSVSIDVLEPVSPAGLTDEEAITISTYEAQPGPMVAALRRPT